jgi:glycosyltransferase involved in cell wall biosynthesis
MSVDKTKICALGALYHGERPEYLHSCLVSLQNQTIKIPIVFVIDGPITSDLEDVLERFDDLGVRFIRNPVNKGLSYALQSGLDLIRNDFDYAIRFDSDDINLPNRFEKLRTYICENNPDLVSSQMYEINEKNEVFSERTVPIGHNKIAKKLPYRNPINHPASAFKISSVLAAGGYQEMPFFEDWYLWIRMFHAGFKVENIDDFLVSFRATDAMVARRYGLSYVKHELNFFHRRSKEKLINPIENWLAFFARLAVKAFGFKAYKQVFYWIRK